MKQLACLAASLIFGVFGQSARADDGYRWVHSFGGSVGGIYPNPLVGHQSGADPSTWALYGTTLKTGPADGDGFGIVYKLTPPRPGDDHWTKTRLYVFKPAADRTLRDGANPNGALVFDKEGSAYGLTSDGGRRHGTVFRLTPPPANQYFWTYTLLTDVNTYPVSPPIAGIAIGKTGGNTGKLYGFTSAEAFELAPPASGSGPWIYTSLHIFTGASGENPYGVPAIGPGGEIYGVTLYSSENVGGPPDEGTVFRLTPPAAGRGAWIYDLLYRFPETAKGLGFPTSVVRGASGALYGVTNQFFGGGVFSLTPPARGGGLWTEKDIYRFTPDDGFTAEFSGSSAATLTILPGSDSIYGATQGAVDTSSGYRYGGGVAFRLDPPAPGETSWSKTTLQSFGHLSASGRYYGANGVFVRGADGTLYSSARYGGTAAYGLVFKLIGAAP